MKRYLWVGLLLLSNSVYALFEDEGARKKLNEMTKDKISTEYNEMIKELDSKVESVSNFYR